VASGSASVTGCLWYEGCLSQLWYGGRASNVSWPDRHLWEMLQLFSTKWLDSSAYFFSSLVKGKEYHTPWGVRMGCSSPLLRPWARRWINHSSLWCMAIGQCCFVNGSLVLLCYLFYFTNVCTVSFSALTLLVGFQERHPASLITCSSYYGRPM